MAKVWPVYEGRRPTHGEPWAQLPVSEAVALLALRPSDFISDVPEDVRFGDVGRDLWFAGYKYVVVEIERKEGKKANWKPGYYKSKITPTEAFRRLVKQAVVTKLGNENVIDLKLEPTTDSRGHEALKITIILAPGAADELADAVVLDALVSMRQRLREMRDDRVPIVEYATQAELAQDDAAQP